MLYILYRLCAIIITAKAYDIRHSQSDMQGSYVPKRAFQSHIYSYIIYIHNMEITCIDRYMNNLYIHRYRNYSFTMLYLYSYTYMYSITLHTVLLVTHTFILCAKKKYNIQIKISF